MTREERNTKLKHFITCLKCKVSGKECDDNCPVQYEAGNMGEIIQNLEAISKALEQEPGHWIPVSERLPEKNGYYLTTTMYYEVYCDYWEEDSFNRTEAVIAWMPLPAPFESQESMLDTKKQEICEYCHEDSDGYVLPIEKNCHAFIRFGMYGWELSLKAKGWHGSAKIKYCPMCGREFIVGVAVAEWLIHRKVRIRNDGRGTDKANNEIVERSGFR